MIAFQAPDVTLLNAKAQLNPQKKSIITEESFSVSPGSLPGMKTVKSRCGLMVQHLLEQLYLLYVVLFYQNSHNNWWRRVFQGPLKDFLSSEVHWFDRGSKWMNFLLLNGKSLKRTINQHRWSCCCCSLLNIPSWEKCLLYKRGGWTWKHDLRSLALIDACSCFGLWILAL